MQDLFTFRAGAIPAGARVAGFRGSEGLSRPYAFDVFLVLTGDLGQEVDMAGAVGARATLRLEGTAGLPPFSWGGILASLTLVSELGPRSVFRAALVPELWVLGNTMHSRVFTRMSIPDVLRAVLAENGISASFDLSGSYATEEHVCQYRESDLDFVSRWMEREGMYYYFEQGDAEEQLVITDDKASAVALLPQPVRYFAQSGRDPSVGGSIRALTCEHTAMPAGVRLRDHDYAKPALDLSGTAKVGGRGQISRYGERFFSAADGQRLAQVRAQALSARKVVFHATGSATHLRPGYSFEVDDHPRPAFNAEYLATAVEHELNQAAGTPEIEELLGAVASEVYRVRVVAIPASTQFRPDERTPWPRIYGFENATVDGPATSEYAQIDDQGRYNVKLHFDESALANGKASTKVRMLQPHGGSPEGFHFPLRKGTEVLCTFLGGDPDRPVIAGVVPNAVTPSAVTLGNHMTNVIQTGGLNRLEMEDPAGAQRVTLSTPTESTFLAMGAPVGGHHFTLQTDAHGYVQTGKNLGVEVKERMSTHVVGDTDERYDEDHRSSVKGDQQQSIDGDRSIAVKGDQAVSILGDHSFDLKGDEDLKIKGNRKHHVTGDHDGRVEGDRHEKVGGKSVVEVTDVVVEVFEADFNFQCAGNETSKVAGDKSAVVQGDTSDFHWGNENHIVGGTKNDMVLGLATSTTVGASVDVKLAAALDLVIGANLEIVLGADVHYALGFHQEIRGIHNRTAEAEFAEAMTTFSVRGMEILEKEMSVSNAEVEVMIREALLVG
jgi:type VI secretion system secreted protein VgrG